MKKTHLISLLIVIGAFAVAALNGCATNPVDRYYELRGAANTSRDVILKAHDAGFVTDKQLVEMDQYEKAVRASLDAVRAALPTLADGEIDFDASAKMADDQTLQWRLGLARDVINALLAHYAALPKPTTQPTTEPSHDTSRN